MLGGSVRFEVPAGVAFDYLVDPANRPAWQSSLRRVEGVTGDPRVGQRWTDVTAPGLRPAMETTELDRPSRWSETGRWRFVSASLSLVFEDADGGCEVTYRFRIDGPGPVGVLGLGLSALAVPAVGADLRRAARLLAPEA